MKIKYLWGNKILFNFKIFKLVFGWNKFWYLYMIINEVKYEIGIYMFCIICKEFKLFMFKCEMDL